MPGRGKIWDGVDGGGGTVRSERLGAAYVSGSRVFRKKTPAIDKGAGRKDDADVIGIVLLIDIKAIPFGARGYLISSMVIAVAPGMRVWEYQEVISRV